MPDDTEPLSQEARFIAQMKRAEARGNNGTGGGSFSAWLEMPVAPTESIQNPDGSFKPMPGYDEWLAQQTTPVHAAPTGEPAPPVEGVPMSYEQAVAIMKMSQMASFSFCRILTDLMNSVATAHAMAQHAAYGRIDPDKFIMRVSDLLGAAHNQANAEAMQVSRTVEDAADVLRSGIVDPA